MKIRYKDIFQGYSSGNMSLHDYLDIITITNIEANSIHLPHSLSIIYGS